MTKLKNIIIIFLVLISTSMFSQTLETLKVDTKKMYDASYNMAFDEVMEYTYPKIFEVVTKQQMLDALNQTFENEVMKVRLVTIDPKFTFSEIKKIDGKSFCVVNYMNAMRMTFEEKFDEEGIKMMSNAFNTSGDYKVVKFEKDRNSFYLEGNAIMIAVADSTTNNQWKFVNYNKSDNGMAKTLLGENVINELGI